MDLRSWETANDAGRSTVKWPRTVPVHLENEIRDFDVCLIRQEFHGAGDSDYSILLRLGRSADAGFVASYPRSEGRTGYLGAGGHNQWENWFVTDCLRDQRFARQFFLGSAELRREGDVARERLLLWNDGSAFWSWHGYPEPEMGTAFRWGESLDVEEFLFRPALAVWAQIGVQLGEENSEAAFARRFASWSQSRRYEAVNWWSGGTRAECEAVLSALFVAHGECEDEGLFLLGADDLRCRSGRKDYPVEVSDDLKRSLKRVWRHFEPFDPRFERFACVRSWAKINSFGVEVRLAPLTAHERVEAMRRWRDWQKQHGD